jgi:uncharacterized protein with HEPN domain
MTNKTPKILLDAVDDEIVYLTVTEDLAELQAALTHLLNDPRNAR